MVIQRMLLVAAARMAATFARSGGESTVDEGDSGARMADVLRGVQGAFRMLRRIAVGPSPREARMGRANTPLEANQLADGEFGPQSMNSSSSGEGQPGQQIVNNVSNDNRHEINTHTTINNMSGGGGGAGQGPGAGMGFNQGPYSRHGGVQALSEFKNGLLGGVKDLAVWQTGVVGVARGLLKMEAAMDRYTAYLVASQRHFADLSYQFAGAYAGLDVGRLNRDIAKANILGDSGAQLINSRNQREQAMAPFEVIGQLFANSVGSAIDDGVTTVLNNLMTVLEWIPGIGDDITKLRERLEQALQTGYNGSTLAQFMAKTDFASASDARKAAGMRPGLPQGGWNANPAPGKPKF